MILLALDQSTTCTGWAIFKNGTLADSGVFLPKKDSEIQDRIYQMYNHIREKIIKENVEIIIFEDTSLNGIQNIMVVKWLCRLQGFIMSLAMERDIKNEMLYPTHWRQQLNFPTGRTPKGKPKPDLKQIAVDYVNNTHNMRLNKNKHDQAEAICIGDAYILINS